MQNSEPFNTNITSINICLQNAARITRALFEICLKKSWPIMASRLLNLSKTIDKRIWGFETPLRQFSILTPEIIGKLEAKRLKVDKLREMDAKEIGMAYKHYLNNIFATFYSQSCQVSRFEGV